MDKLIIVLCTLAVLSFGCGKQNESVAKKAETKWVKH